MLRKIDANEARTNFYEILLRVDAGEAFTITRNGKPIADVVRSCSVDRLKTETAIVAVLKAKKHKVSDAVLAKLKEFGRN
jgi:prevent-host-death family protein